MEKYKEKLSKIEKLYNESHNDFIVRKTRKEYLLKQKEQLEKDIEEINIESLEQVNVLLQKMSESQREDACKQLETLGTYALQYAYSPDYEMKIDIHEIRKRPNADVYIINKKTGIKTNPLTENGGGIVDIISMALRIITMQVHDPFIDGPIILDEPSKMVSKEYVPLLSQFLKNISDDFGRQIILITHNEFLAQIADKRLNVRLGDDDISVVE